MHSSSNLLDNKKFITSGISEWSTSDNEFSSTLLHWGIYNFNRGIEGFKTIQKSIDL